MKGSGWVLVLLSTIAFLNYLDRGIQAGVVPNWNCPCTCEKSSPRDWDVMTCCDNGAHGRITTKNNTCSLPNGTTHAPSCTCPAGDGALTCVTDCADFGPVSVSATGILVGIFFGGYSLAAPFFCAYDKVSAPFQNRHSGLVRMDTRRRIFRFISLIWNARIFQGSLWYRRSFFLLCGDALDTGQRTRGTAWTLARHLLLCNTFRLCSWIWRFGYTCSDFMAITLFCGSRAHASAGDNYLVCALQI